MFGKKTRAVIVVVCTLASLLVSGCGNPNNQNSRENKNNKREEESNNSFKKEQVSDQIEASTEYLSFDEAIERSNCIVIAKLKGIGEKNYSREYEFTLIDTIIGNMSDVNFLITEGYANLSVEGHIIEDYSTYETEYEVGKEYILVIAKSSSVYFERDLYMILGEIFIELDDTGNIAQYQRYHQTEKITFENAEELSSYVKTIIDDTKTRLVYGIPFTKSTDIPDIVDMSQYIVKAVVSEIKFENPDSNRDTYICKVTERLRGSTRDYINIVLFKDTVTIGKEYLFLLNKDTEDSLIYALSSVNSVVDLDKDKSIVEEIAELITK